MKRTPRRLAGTVGLCAVLGLGVACIFLAPGCGEDPTGPTPDKVIQIRDIAVIPSSFQVHAGSLIEWQNWSQEARTVTSGDSAGSPDAGKLFDQSLAGYASGHAIGGTFQYRFDHPDTVHYFSRLFPPGYKESFRGTIYVVP
jgi:plastocyanin